LPQDLTSFLERFGTDEQCRAYLFRARWPDGFRCSACGHERAWAHKARLIDECAACGKQHSLLAGTIFEQTKTGLFALVSRAGSRRWSGPVQRANLVLARSEGAPN
jgi:hypothetical protein